MAEIKILDGVTVTCDGDMIKVKGPKGEIIRKLFHPRIKISVTPESVIVMPQTKKENKKDKMFVNTFVSHIKNLMAGVRDGFEYKLKICSGHFPMTVSVAGNELIVKNFLGEKVPRKVKLPDGAKVVVQGEEIIVNALNKETAGQAAAKIEQLTRITNRDKRIFQDGCYIINKAGKAVAK